MLTDLCVDWPLVLTDLWGTLREDRLNRNYGQTFHRAFHGTPGDTLHRDKSSPGAFQKHQKTDYIEILDKPSPWRLSPNARRVMIGIVYMENSKIMHLCMHVLSKNAHFKKSMAKSTALHWHNNASSYSFILLPMPMYSTDIPEKNLPNLKLKLAPHLSDKATLINNIFYFEVTYSPLMPSLYLQVYLSVRLQNRSQMH